ncbi:hypothetical protein GCM10010486_36000 [Nonomuraea roseoviolacea subsp. carminata]|uniref:Tetratricopeptide (TPR) repeat protein n=1 Tax=Nonomuraea roseoviolacea subsp. carminata TaxID=160689 RepID=A0ABT1JY06_9ACTN|nr:tetratricopeptide (TPR) repeat protein [Nonomuraea roseoviolacea subsp. carminata]
MGLADPRVERAEKAAERGEEHRLAGRHEAAVEEFTRALDLVPGHGYALGSRGQALNSMGHVEAALAGAELVRTVFPLGARTMVDVAETREDPPG